MRKKWTFSKILVKMGKKTINSLFRCRSSWVYADNFNGKFSHDCATKHVIPRDKVIPFLINNLSWFRRSGRGTKPDIIGPSKPCPNQRQMRLWHLSGFASSTRPTKNEIRINRIGIICSELGLINGDREVQWWMHVVQRSTIKMNVLR